MTKIIYAIFLTFYFSTSFASPKIDSSIEYFSSYTLNNGLKVILLPIKNTTSTGVIMTIKVGSKHEGYGETGMAHLLEHMLFKSTKEQRDIKGFLTQNGASWNGSTSLDRTSYFETFDDPSNTKLEQILRMESQRLTQATFTKQDLEKEMTVVRNELERNENSPSTKLYQSALINTFSWHGYGHPTIGERSDIEDAPFSNLQAFYKQHYRPSNTFLVIYPTRA